MTTYNVTARRRRHGWELHVHGVGVTQSPTLKDAEATVRDFLALDSVTGACDVVVTPELPDGIDKDIRSAQRSSQAAAEATKAAASALRVAVHRLKVGGVPGRDIAFLLDISPQRVSHLLAARGALECSSAEADLRIWGKSLGLPRPYPLLGHLIDTAETAGVVWDIYLTPSQRAIVSAGLRTDESHARSLVKFWAGLHDIGKVIPGFQAQGPSQHVCFLTEPAYSFKGTIGDKIRHERASHLTLSRLLADFGYPTSERATSSVAQQIAQMLGGHHGRFSATLSGGEILDPLAAEPRLGANGWHVQRQMILRAMHELTGSPRPVQDKVPVQAVVLITAVIVLADWLASQEDALLRMFPSADRLAEQNGINNHAALAAAQAPDLLRGAGLRPAAFEQRDFAAQFPQIPLPNALQQSLISELPDLVDGPGLLLVTAPTGDGKTEAALFAARVLNEASGAHGMFVALPTMATSDQMYRRVKEYAEHNLHDDAALTLLHSMSWLSTDYAEHPGADEQHVVTGESHNKRATAEAGNWLRGARRGLLAPLAVGTIDQALLAALPSKYNVLRLLGLSGKTVVIDEAHAYDPYMHGLLLRLLTWLGALRAPVVLMSATLTGTVAGSLVRAYRTGCGHRASVPVEATYPGWLFVDAGSGEVSAPRCVASNRPRELAVQLRNVRHDLDRSSPESREVALLRELQPVLAGSGGCVAVICTTVAEAQATYMFLKEEFSQAPNAPLLRLLHARFPADRREAITKEIEGLVGKDNHQRTPTVVLATQVIEQSLDLDFDLVISDLAPLAMLLQRAGRCWRHERERPRWSTEPQLSVLVPVDAEERVVRPDSWGEVYHEALLLRTAELLLNRNRTIRVPEDVQALVDSVYAPEFPATDSERLHAADGLRFADEQAQRLLSELAAIPAPGQCRDLHTLSKHEVDDELIRTRLGADSVRVLCCYLDGDGGRFLEPECLTPLPEPGKGRRFSKDQAGAILKRTIPVRGSLLRGRGPENQAPDSWVEDHRVREVVVLPFRVVGGVVQGALVGSRRFELTPELGLVAAPSLSNRQLR